MYVPIFQCDEKSSFYVVEFREKSRTKQDPCIHHLSSFNVRGQAGRQVDLTGRPVTGELKRVQVPDSWQQLAAAVLSMWPALSCAGTARCGRVAPMQCNCGLV
jgi:hypothetical protein